MAVPRKRPDDGPADFGFLYGGGSGDAAQPGADSARSESSLAESLLEGTASIEAETTEVGKEDVPRDLSADGAASKAMSSGADAKRNSNAPMSIRGDSSNKEHRSASHKCSPMVLGYAIAITLLLLFCLATGRLSLMGNHALESLPDIRPLSPNEFQKVPDEAAVAPNHVMKLGEARRFGDVVVTALRVTREPLQFQHFQSGLAEESLTTKPVLKLWVKFENVSQEYGFPPFDAGLMSKRTPEHSADESTIANSYLTVKNPSDGEDFRVLNNLQSMDNNFVISGQESAKVIMPSESFDTFVACSEEIAATATAVDSQYVWRVQFRKGVNEVSGNGVTTLIDVNFTGSDVVEPPLAAPSVSG